MLSNAAAQFGLVKGAVVGSDTGRTTNLDGVPMTVNILVRLPGGTLRVRARAGWSREREWRRSSAARAVQGGEGDGHRQADPHTGDPNVYRLQYSPNSRAVA